MRAAVRSLSPVSMTTRVKPQAAQLGHGLGHAGLQRVLHADDAHELAIDGQVQRRQPLGLLAR